MGGNGNGNVTDLFLVDGADLFPVEIAVEKKSPRKKINARRKMKTGSWGNFKRGGTEGEIKKSPSQWGKFPLPHHQVARWGIDAQL